MRFKNYPRFPSPSSIFRAALVALFALGLSTSDARAQTQSTLTGDVRDQAGAVVAGVQVTLRSLETGLARDTVSDAEGRYTFPALPVGAYEVRAAKEGFKSFRHERIELTVNETATLDIGMEVAPVGEEITVTGEAALVNTQTPELSYLVGERAIRELPLNGRNYTDLAYLQPGVIAYPHRDTGSVVAHGVGASINGQDPRSNVYLLDGTPQNDFTNGPAGSAAGTSLGIESIREFRVETNAYSAEFGRNSGGQINVVSKSGTNEFHGSLFEYHRNDNFDARNFFDPEEKPEFKRNQFGGSVGGPIKTDKLFFFASYEALRENLGRTILTVVPDLDARAGIVTRRDANGNVVRENVGVNPAVLPYLNEFPLPNTGPTNVVGNLASHIYAFNQKVDQNFVSGRIDYNRSASEQLFARYTFDDAEQLLPTDYPQFPRTFISRNQFFTGEYRRTQSANTIHTFRLNFSRTRIGQNVEANTTQNLTPFVPGQDLVGGIDIGGIPGRFGPQTSANLRLTQNVIGGEYGMVHSRGRHLIKAGGLVERYQDNMVNPTFSLGIFTFNSVRDFLQNRPVRFIGLTPGGAFDRYWRFTLLGGYVQDTYRAAERLTLNAGVRYEFATLPVDINGRDSALPNLSDRAPTVGPLYRNPTTRNIAPRVGFAWDVFGDGRTSVRGGYGIYFNTNNHQNLIVTVTNPPATPRPVINNPTFPVPSFTGSISIRPVQFDLDNPYTQVWNLNVQRELWFDTVVTVGYAGSRGVHLLRSSDVNIPVPVTRPDGTLFFPAGQTRPNTAFTTIELKSSDGDSWYNALVFEARRRFAQGFSAQASYTFSRNIDTTQASTFFSDATNGTTTAFPEFPTLEYNKGLADYHAKHNFVFNFTWELPFAKGMRGAKGKILDGWQLAGIGQMRSGNPLTVFVARNRSRSQWSPSLAPGIGFDRPSLAAGFTHETAVTGNPDQYFNPAAFVLQPAGTLGALGRGTFIGPNLRIFDLSAVKNTRVGWLGENTVLQFRVEAFNLFNRANFAPPSLIAFTGAADNETVLPTFGRIRSTVTSSRQIQLGVRVTF
ncbi:MAG TPA: TonB-dependent receptor [Pyrinomonadaceae bacterium]|nr:TonB-dependent receptor [Pyrinomonadaceae bacterium]